MPIPCELPQEFSLLAGKVFDVHQYSSNEFRGSCPMGCGSSGSRISDRFVMWLSSKATGEPMGWCRDCGYKVHPLREKDWRPSEEDIRKAAEAARLRLQAEIEKAESALRRLRSAKEWQRYHDEMTAENRELWRQRGLGDFWQDYFMLGYCKHFDVREWFPDDDGDSGSFRTVLTTPTLSIPIWNADDSEPVDMRHRLLAKEAEEGIGKYRPHLGGLPMPVDVLNRGKTTGMAVLIEGEIKGRVAFALLENPDIQILTIPSKNPGPSAREFLKTMQYDPVIHIPDPECWSDSYAPDRPTSAQRWASYVGVGRSLGVQIPMKIDDAINAGAFDKRGLMRVLDTARPIDVSNVKVW